MDVIGEATNSLDGKPIEAVAYGSGSSHYNLPQNVPYGFRKPELVPVLIPTSNLRHGPIESADELPGIVTYYNGENNLNSVKINCKIYANQNDCFHQSYCGWCGASTSCISGNVQGPIDPCGDLSTYIFSAPIANIGPQVMNNNQGMSSVSITVQP